MVQPLSVTSQVFETANVNILVIFKTDNVKILAAFKTINLNILVIFKAHTLLSFPFNIK